MKAKAIDEKFDSGGEVSDQIDCSKASRRANTATEFERIDVDFPQWVVQVLDRRAELLGVTRKKLIMLCIAKRLGGMEGAPLYAGHAEREAIEGQSRN